MRGESVDVQRFGNKFVLNGLMRGERESQAYALKCLFKLLIGLWIIVLGVAMEGAKREDFSRFALFGRALLEGIPGLAARVGIKFRGSFAKFVEEVIRELVVLKNKGDVSPVSIVVGS